MFDGRVAEWLKAHDSKSCDGVNPFGGSNPLSSAILTASCRFFVFAISGFLVYLV